MNIYSYRRRNALILMIVCLLFVSRYSFSQTISAEEPARSVAGSSYVHPVGNAARLIISRIPNLGNQVTVDLHIDGIPVAGIGYGRTYEVLLRPGRHILSVQPTPHPKWLTRWEMTLDMRSGQTYTFTAMGNHSGDLILRAD